MILSYLRTVVLYLVLIFAVRLMGKRQIGELEPAEFVVTMLVANLAAIPMQDGGIPLYSGLVPILTVLAVELVLSGLTMHSVRLRRFLCGKPVILIDNGRLCQDNLRRTRITLEELNGQLRQKDVLDIRSVQYAILETDGKLSVFPFAKDRPASAKDAGIAAAPRAMPVTVIIDGYLSREDLHRAGKDQAWLDRQLRLHQATIEQTLLLSVSPGDKVHWLGKEYAL